MKPKTCRVCKAEYTPSRMAQKVCSPLCALALAKSDRAKQERKKALLARNQARQRLESMKSIPVLLQEADKAFCAFIRARDKSAGHACISSGKPLNWNGNQVDAGHYRSRGAASHLRYDERNAHAQSKHDNRHLGGNVVEYRKGLIARIGIEAVEALENDNSTHKWTREELREIRDRYRAMAKGRR